MCIQKAVKQETIPQTVSARIHCRLFEHVGRCVAAVGAAFLSHTARLRSAIEIVAAGPGNFIVRSSVVQRLYGESFISCHISLSSFLVYLIQ